MKGQKGAGTKGRSPSTLRPNYLFESFLLRDGTPLITTKPETTTRNE